MVSSSSRGYANWSFGQISISSVIQGRGPALVLLHGFGGKASDWKEVSELLSEHFTVIVPNLQPLFLGAVEFSFSEQVDVLASFLESVALEHQQIHLVGSSYGGCLAAALRTVPLGFIQSAVLINPMPPNPTKRTTTPHLGWILRYARSAFLLSLYLGSPFGKKALSELARNIRPDLASRFHRFQLILNRQQKIIFYLVRRFSKIIADENWRSWEAKLSANGVEVLLIFSKKDQVFGAKSSEWWRSNTLNSESVKLETGKHMAIKTHAVEIKNILVDFFGLSEPRSERAS